MQHCCSLVAMTSGLWNSSAKIHCTDSQWIVSNPRMVFSQLNCQQLILNTMSIEFLIASCKPLNAIV